MLNAEILENMFGSDEAFGMRFRVFNRDFTPKLDENGDQVYLTAEEMRKNEDISLEVLSEFPNGDDGVVPYYFAQHVMEIMANNFGDTHSCHIVEFETTNPNSRVCDINPSQEYALVVIDYRYLIDPANKIVFDVNDHAVFDLENPNHLREAQKLYGNPEKWVGSDGWMLEKMPAEFRHPSNQIQAAP
jgi:hypothetical protein